MMFFLLNTRRVVTFRLRITLLHSEAFSFRARLTGTLNTNAFNRRLTA
jgi:hypothetical protein